MAAVVVAAKDRDVLRGDIEGLVPDGWWHTTEVLQEPGGRRRVLSMLDCFEAEHDACVVVHASSVGEHDKDGEQARQRCLAALLETLGNAGTNTHEPVSLVVMEGRRTNHENNNDLRTRKNLVTAGTVHAAFTVTLVSPGAEHLLWLPDVVCMAYRKRLLEADTDLFSKIESFAEIIEI